MLVPIIILIIGILLLTRCADLFVEGAASTARNLKLSRIIIGLTVLAFGTSTPELAVSFNAMLLGNEEFVLGNVIGSNVINVLLILGSCSLLCSCKLKRQSIRKELPLMLVMTLLFCVVFIDNLFNNNLVNTISKSDGFVLILFFMIAIYYLFSIVRKRTENDNPNILEDDPKYPMKKSVILTVVGMVGVIAGSFFVVYSASEIAILLNISKRVVAITIIALGTSLPELITSVMAAKKGENDLLIGNIIGSNLFNIGIVLGLPIALLGDVSAIAFTYIDLFVLLASSFILFFVASNDRVVTKKEGIIMITMFIIYFAYIIFI